MVVLPLRVVGADDASASEGTGAMTRVHSCNSLACPFCRPGFQSQCIDCNSMVHLYTGVATDRNGRARTVVARWVDLVLCRCGEWQQSERLTWIPKRGDKRWVSAVMHTCAHCGLRIWIAWFVGGGERQRCAGIRFEDSLPAWRGRLRRLLLQRAGVDA